MVNGCIISVVCVVFHAFFSPPVLFLESRRDSKGTGSSSQLIISTKFIKVFPHAPRPAKEKALQVSKKEVPLNHSCRGSEITGEEPHARRRGREGGRIEIEKK
jgi:hypothetical protein